MLGNYAMMNLEQMIKSGQTMSLGQAKAKAKELGNVPSEGAIYAAIAGLSIGQGIKAEKAGEKVFKVDDYYEAWYQAYYIDAGREPLTKDSKQGNKEAFQKLANIGFKMSAWSVPDRVRVARYVFALPKLGISNRGTFANKVMAAHPDAAPTERELKALNKPRDTTEASLNARVKRVNEALASLSDEGVMKAAIKVDRDIERLYDNALAAIAKLASKVKALHDAGDLKAKDTGTRKAKRRATTLEKTAAIAGAGSNGRRPARASVH
jgi:hypothetical protein